MEKILLAIDNMQINPATLDFAGSIASLSRSKLTGVVLDEKNEELLASEDKQIDTTTAVTTSGAVKAFKKACGTWAIRHSLHYDKGAPAKALVDESRFADLIVLGRDLSFSAECEAVPCAFMKQVLSKSECPVLIAPYTYYGIEEIVFAYDGSASSVYALKLFTYLFPQLLDERLIVTQVNREDDTGESIHQWKRLSELLQANYSCVGYHVLKGHADEELLKYLAERKNAMIIMGAYGRTMLPGISKRSTADLILKTVDAPVFIAHR